MEMKQYKIKVVGFANGKPCREAGAYIKNFDPEAYPGRGSIQLSWSADDAKPFNTAKEAFEYWQTQCKTDPIRPDGMPNRPLTAYNVSVLQ